MSKSDKHKKGKTFILELKLSTLDWQCCILQKRFEIARKMYNQTLSYALKQLSLMKESKYYRRQLQLYQETNSKIKHTTDKETILFYKKELKAIGKVIKSIRQSFHLTEYGLHNYIKRHQHNYNKHIDCHTSQKISTRVWSSLVKVIFKHKTAHFKKYGSLESVESKSNETGIRFRNNMICWNDLEIPVIIRKNDLFVEECLALHKVKYCRIVRKVIRGKEIYYVQLIMDGIPPEKRVNNTGAIRHKKNPNKRVGKDIGTSTVAVASEAKVFIVPIAPRVPEFEKEIIRLLRKLDRSRRCTNPNNFNADGTVKRGSKLIWNRSNNYQNTLSELKELYRKRKVYVRGRLCSLANQILSCGDEVYTENMNFKSLAKRSKETKKTKRGKFQRNKRFGKSIGSYAPAMLLRIIERKLNYIQKGIHKVNTRTFKASQYNHITNTYKKKKLHQRWTSVGNQKVQRDLYSAFLLMNSEDNLKHTNRDLCKQTFDGFILLHNQCIERLKESKEKLPSSIGIKN